MIFTRKIIFGPSFAMKMCDGLKKKEGRHESPQKRQ